MLHTSVYVTYCNLYSAVSKCHKDSRLKSYTLSISIKLQVRDQLMSPISQVKALCEALSVPGAVTYTLLTLKQQGRNRFIALVSHYPVLVVRDIQNNC